MQRKSASLARIAWIVLALLAFLVVEAHGQGASQTSIVMVDRVGPMLLPGRTPAEAARAYAQHIADSRVFPEQTKRFVRWAESVPDRPEVTLDSLRAEGKPIIGVQLNMSKDIVGSAGWKKNRMNYAKAIREAGGIPLFLPPAGDKAHIDTLLQEVDHLLLVGGEDVHPRAYHQRLYRGVLDTNLKRDRYDIKVLRRALALHKPVDGICRGFQVINVALGGKLANIGRAQSMLHRSPNWKPVRHDVVLEPDSDTARETSALRLTIPSLHHQKVTKTGRGLRDVARSPDGILEAVEGFDGNVRGLAWHPEKSKSPRVRAVFRGMVERANRGWVAPARSGVVPTGRDSSLPARSGTPYQTRR